MDKEVVTELIQNDFTEQNLEQELQALLLKENKEKLFLDYFDLENSLGGKGASNKTAKLIVNGLA